MSFPTDPQTQQMGEKKVEELLAAMIAAGVDANVVEAFRRLFAFGFLK